MDSCAGPLLQTRPYNHRRLTYGIQIGSEMLGDPLILSPVEGHARYASAAGNPSTGETS